MNLTAPRELSHPLLGAALEAASAACALIVSPPADLLAQIQDKGPKDFATGVDIACEEAMRSILGKATPRIGLLGEEGGGPGVEDPLYWLADPIDGTLNFASGSKLCGMTLCLMEGGSPAIAVTALPRLGELHLAVRGQGAFCNGARLRVSQEGLGRCVITVGSPFSNKAQRSESYLRKVELLSAEALSSTNLAASSVALAWTAAGQFGLSLFKGNHPWDMQSGVALIREAGGVAWDADGSEHGVLSRETVAGGPRAMAELRERLEREGLLDFSWGPGKAAKAPKP